MYIESIKIEDGKIFHLSYHQRRYQDVVKSLDGSSFSLEDFINPPSKKGVFRCRILYTEKEIKKVEYFSYKKREIHSLKLIESNSIEYSKKYANRSEIETLFSQKGESDDVLIVKNGYLTDISIANVALLKDDIWYTPKKPLLKGTTRQRLLESRQIIAKDIRVEDIYTYNGVALLNAMIDFDIIQEKDLRSLIC